MKSAIQKRLEKLYGHASANLRAAHYTIDPNTADRAALDLALAYEPSAVAVSWESQMKAEAYVNTHELYDVLKEIERLTMHR